jgi:Xaa-Pro aminopeptidase
MRILFLMLLINCTGLMAQVSSDFHTQRRQALRELMPQNSVLIVFANEIKNRSNDVDYDYHQDPNFYYLTGLNETDAVLVIFKNKHNVDDYSTNELLYVNEITEQSSLWTASYMGVNAASKTLGIVCMNNNQYKNLALDTHNIQRVFVLNDGEQTLQDDIVLHQLKKNTHTLCASIGVKPNKQQPHLLLAKLRQHKQSEEILLLQKAINITALGFDFMLNTIDSNHTEHQAQAMVEYKFAYNGAQHKGYPSICGAGNNGTILHYTANKDSVPAQQLLLVDAGAEYNNYTADITRTFPTNGKFTVEQKTLYNLVLKAQQAGIDACVAGNAFIAPHRAAQNVIAQGLLELGIIKNRNEFDTYFMHGTSHYIGLDVHDVGTYGALQPNDVITVEPGIYIKNGSPCNKKWWGIAIRIEDDIQITIDKPIVMSSAIPRDIETLERLLKRSK